MVYKNIKLVLGRYVTFLPIISFVWSNKIWHSWKISFIIGGAIALAYIIFTAISRIDSDTLMVGVNLFLIVGAVMYLFDISFLKFIYDKFLFSTIFLFVFIAGIFLTIFSKYGFAGIKNKSSKTVRLMSCYMLMASFVSLVFSFIFSYNILIAGLLPFLFLVIVRKILVDYADKISY